MNVRLQEMKLENFKGIRDLKIDFNRVDTKISGRNATGKTTIVDAFTWLFFNKDSQGSTDFDVKTKNSKGEFLHNLEHSVEAVLFVDGDEKTFKKVFKEKYVKKRGSNDAEFSGHTTDYFIDDVPRKKKEYDDIVNKLFDARLFPIITDPFYFSQKMNWRERRKLLIDLLGDISDDAVFASHSELAALEPALNGKTVEDLRAQLKIQMKPINSELKTIPIKINEAKRAIPSKIEEFDNDKYLSICDEINELEMMKNIALSGGAIAEKETELINLRNRKLLLENEIPNYKKQKQELNELSFKKEDIERNTIKLKREKDYIIKQQKDNEAQRDSLRQKYIDRSAEEYDSSKNICPTCKRPLPDEQIQEFIERFNLNKSNDLEKINKKGKALKDMYDDLENNLKLLEVKIEQENEAIKEIDVLIAEKIKEIANIQENFDKQQQPKIDKIESQINNLDDEIKALKCDKSSVVIEYDGKINALKEEKAKFDAITAQINLAEIQKKRIDELEAREDALASEYSKKEEFLYLTDLFVKAKVEMLTQNINSQFELCEFKMFDIQINGGLEECCEIIYKGVSYANLNNAAKINCGLDVINTICNFKDLYVPIFVDNAESVNDTLKTNSQQIKLFVTNDENLEIVEG